MASSASSSLRNRKGKTESTPLSPPADGGVLQDRRSLDNHVECSAAAFRITPLRERSAITRLDVAPFVVVYAILIKVDLSLGDGGVLSSRTAMTAVLTATLLAHLAVVLIGQWRVRIRAIIGYQRLPLTVERLSAKEWTHCLVESIQSQSILDADAGIVTVQYSELDGTAIVSFQDHVFRCSLQQPDLDIKLWSTTTTASNSLITTEISSLAFRQLNYPTQMPLSFYSSWQGHGLASAVTAGQVYGPNATVLKLPSFGELLSEQVLAPFFLFQVFCVVLWSLDEYWYYAQFTLLTLVFFESTMAYSRLHSLQRLHQAGHKGTDRVWVRRAAQWMRIPSRELVPGDVVLLSSSDRPVTVPADICLQAGTAVVDEALLTGESLPQLKHGLDAASKDSSTIRLDLQDGLHKESILFGGTVLLVSTPSPSSSGCSSCAPMSPPPHQQGILGVVLRTGFETAQGDLLRTMAHSSKSGDSVHTWDTFIFIFLLVCCALAAASWVLFEGWSDDRRNRFRLVLHVIIIITSVVPPELPMELSLAITNSVADLMRRCQVYCTEHYRIPWAGQVDVCCFDKTGTLTSDEMRLRGVRLFDDDDDNNNSNGSSSTAKAPFQGDREDDRLGLLDDGKPIAWPTLRVMAACHSLAMGRPFREHGLHEGPPVDSVIGDPLERIVLKHAGYRLVGNDLVAAVLDGSGSKKGNRALSILHRFAFSSKLKRMTVLATEEGGHGTLWALTKGAPETLKELLSSNSIPTHYEEVASYHMGRGRRVLAMAYREVGNLRNLQSLKDGGREPIERDLIFGGFLVLDCPLKTDSKSVVSELQQSGHKVVMITGDALLTAAEVARQVGIIRRSQSKDHRVYTIQRRADSEKFSSGVRDPLSLFECTARSGRDDSASSMKLSNEAVAGLLKMAQDGAASFCISGDVLVQLAVAASADNRVPLPTSTLDEKLILMTPAAQAQLTKLVPLVTVFARHAPHQKEAVVAAFNHGGYQTLMCGDGTNDVGALKRANVGISLISAPDVESKQRSASARLKADRKSPKGTKTRNRSKMEETLRQLREAQEELDSVELGDASVAAPFTARTVSIRCCKDVIQQGRCTLVTMLQIYKILGLNCLVNALVLSRLFLHGVKQGDRQLTILGIVVAVLFFFVTRAQPLSVLSVTRPPASVLSRQAIMSIVGQFLIHAGCILGATYMALLYVDPYDPSLVPDGPFNPNVLNSCTFLLTCCATFNTFAANYRGRPFMQDLKDNKLLYRSLLICYATLFICALEAFPPLNDLLQLTPLPSDSVSVGGMVDVIDFRTLFCGIMGADTLLSFAWEGFVTRSF